MAKGEIHDPLVIIGSLERGDVTASLNEEITKVLKALQEAAGPKSKARGSVSLSLKFELQGQSCSIEADISSKVPKAQRSSSFRCLLGVTRFAMREHLLHDLAFVAAETGLPVFEGKPEA